MTWNQFAPARVFRFHGENRGVMLAVWFNVVLFALSVVALPFDHRQILGLNPWIKPIKFHLSVIVFLLTIAVLLSAVGRTARWTRTRRVIGWGIGLTMIVENGIITLQSLRGVRSHMNYDTPVDASLFAVMGVAIAIAVVLTVVLLGLYCVTRTELPGALTLGIRLGLLVLLAGSAEGVMMVARNGHIVGAHDGVAGLPFLNWSTAHGDLRVPHFFALHALQAFILAGWALSTTRMRAGLQTALVFCFAAAYAGVVWKLFAQATAGIPLIAR